MNPEYEPFVSARNSIIDLLKKDLIGPPAGVEETLRENPVTYYMSGILYPQKTNIESEDNADQDEGKLEVSGDQSENANIDNPVSQANQFYPSSMGISFYVRSKKPEIIITYEFSKYIRNPETKQKEYLRSSYSKSVVISKNTDRFDLDDLDAQLRINWRDRGKDLWLVTVSLVNSAVSKKAGEFPEAENCLFQCGISVVFGKYTDFERYPHYGYYSPDQEKRILELLYRNKYIFAVGHGCSVGWTEKNGKAEIIRSEIIPVASVPQMDFTIHPSCKSPEANRALSMRFLSSINSDPRKVTDSLEKFSSAYSDWVTSLNKTEVFDFMREDKANQIWTCKLTAGKISEGVKLLKKDKKARQVFAWMNEVMLRQMDHTDRIDVINKAPEIHKKIYDKNLYDYEEKTFDKNWRPFQLAFILITIRSIVDPECDRDVLDLIWFPTGGGKTEAYLGLSAFTILWQRLLYKDKSSGTNVFMRYTLRALTAQQFQRASKLICALELLRRDNSDHLGNKQIRLGLFVGEVESPNRYNKAKIRVDDIRRNGKNDLQILNCPWCNHPILSVENGTQELGIESDDYHFKIYCLNPSCAFNNSIPLQIVDDDLYENPPDFLIGTIDKFARMTWEPEMYSLMGYKTEKSQNEYLPPTLIIQDELHLISGPLGSVMGLYEAAFDHLCSRNNLTPKIVASTATVRNAAEQIRNTFNRSLHIFPPPGLDIDDSYFARVDENHPGRLYAGILNPGKSGVYSNVRVLSALLQAPMEIDFPDEKTKDNFYTLVGYYNALRELGKSNTLAYDDIPKRINFLADQSGNHPREPLTVKEMRSGVDQGDIAVILDQMKKTVSSSESIDLLLATNMISVGIDVSRLGLMVVTGQPKTIAEYIQATSRVGRDKPGLIVTLFSPTKIRDRSHYERFMAFHKSIYKDVEPSSVTPFSPQVTERVLHAILIIVMRSYEYMRAKDKGAGKFERGSEEVNKLRSFLQERIKNILAAKEGKVLAELDELLDHWEKEQQIAKSRKSLLYYDFHGTRGVERLLKSFGDTGTGWDTLHSMRNVEHQIILTQKNYY